MATFYGIEYGAAIGSSGSAPSLMSPCQQGGKLRVLNFVYTVPASNPPDEVAGNTDILLGRIPQGSRIWAVYFGSEDLSDDAATLTLKMGSTAISADLDVTGAFAAAVDLTAVTGVGNANGVLVTKNNEEIKAVVGAGALDKAAAKCWGLIIYSAE